MQPVMRRSLFGYLVLLSMVPGLGVIAMWPLGRVHTVVVGYGWRGPAGSDEWVVVLDRRSVWLGRTNIPPHARPSARRYGSIWRLLAPSDTAETIGDAVAPGGAASSLGFMLVHGPIVQIAV